MNKKESFKKLQSQLQENATDEIILEPRLGDKENNIRLDIVSKDDFELLKGIYKKSNENINIENSVNEIKEDFSNQFKDLQSSMNISNKKTITVSEFEKLYSIGEETQRKLRGRTRDPLPYIQLNQRGTVLYDPKKIDKWMENYCKER